jgi:hypothetical protein
MNDLRAGLRIACVAGHQREQKRGGAPGECAALEPPSSAGFAIFLHSVAVPPPNRQRRFQPGPYSNKRRVRQIAPNIVTKFALPGIVQRNPLRVDPGSVQDG